MHSEKQQKTEQLNISPEKSPITERADAFEIPRGLKERQAMLESLKLSISKKLFFSLEEKLALEKKQMNELLGIAEHRSHSLSKYSFILDSQYFEQELMQ